MQEKDAITMEYFEVPARFADLVNGYIHHGEQVVKAEEVVELNRGVLRLGSKEGKVAAQVLTADVVREVRHSTRVTVVFLENQSAVHYAMPVRVMNEEGSYYHRQWRDRAKQHKQEKDLAGAEYLSGFGREDKLIPAVTIVVYWGQEVWDGPRRLKDMLDLEGYPLDLQRYIVDYPIHLLEVRAYEHLEDFQTDIRYVFGFLQRESDKKQLRTYVEEHEEVFSRLDSDAYNTISVMSRSGKLLEKKERYEEEGSCNMCKALDEMMEDSRQEGRLEGRLEGIIGSLLAVLSRVGEMSEELEKRIRQERNIERLEMWFQSAIEVKSLEEFLQRM